VVRGVCLVTISDKKFFVERGKKSRRKKKGGGPEDSRVGPVALFMVKFVVIHSPPTLLLGVETGKVLEGKGGGKTGERACVLRTVSGLLYPEAGIWPVGAGPINTLTALRFGERPGLERGGCGVTGQRTRGRPLPNQRLRGTQKKTFSPPILVFEAPKWRNEGEERTTKKKGGALAFGGRQTYSQVYWPFCNSPCAS